LEGRGGGGGCSLEGAFEIKGQKLTLTATMDRSKVQEQAGGTNHWIQFEWDNSNISFAEILMIGKNKKFIQLHLLKNQIAVYLLMVLKIIILLNLV